MKKLLLFVVLIIAVYLVYDNFIKEKEEIQINAPYNKVIESVDVDSPALQPREYANYEETIKNISKNPLTNIVVTYLVDAKPSVAKINKLDPDEEIIFKTNPVMLNNMDPLIIFKVFNMTKSNLAGFIN